MRLAFEVALISCVLAVVALRPGFRAWRTSVSRPFLALLAIVTMGLIMGHLDRGRAGAFPFVYWHMYTQAKTAPTIEHLELTATTRAGERLELNGGQIFPSLGLGTFRIYSRLLGIAYDARVAHKPDAQAMLRGIARGYERLHPEQPLARVTLDIVTTPYRELRRGRRTIATVELP